jgi:hypothetical protein
VGQLIGYVFESCSTMLGSWRHPKSSARRRFELERLDPYAIHRSILDSDLTRSFDLGADSVIDEPADTFSFTLAFTKLADRWLFGHGRSLPGKVPVASAA